MFDVFFLTTGEAGSVENLARLKEKADPLLIENVKGFWNAHKACAIVSNTEWFYVVDADAWIVDDFEFTHQPIGSQVQVFRSINPVNGLQYGHGAVKMFRREMFHGVQPSVDITTSLGGIVAVNKISNEHRFNTDAYSSWRCAFRECVKLSSKVIDNQQDIATNYRLAIWCNQVTSSPFAMFVLQGAKAGRAYGTLHTGDTVALSLINNEDWLREQYEKV
jgi:hypothetical protein